MSTLRHPFSLLLMLSVALASLPAEAKKAKKLTLGVFLPTSISEGQERFKFGEDLATQLTDALDTPVVSMNFGRFEDFQKAATRGKLDLAVIDGWIGVTQDRQMTAAGFALVKGAGTHERWAVVSRTRTLVKDLAGKKLAVSRGISGSESRLISNVLFEGDFSAKNFKLVTAPNVESVLKLLETKAADAAIVPLAQAPAEFPVVYRSGRFPKVLVLRGKAVDDEVMSALFKLEGVGPFSGFRAAEARQVASFKRLLDRGPAKRQCVMAEAPTLPLDTSRFLNFGEVGFVLPRFTEYVEISSELPDP